ncbi:MAG TPA: 2-dehydropantoate 2-reductase [Gemmatimonadales bacterium]|nr:2-dehydropantoate 2-reductase [Gemmatimonadales bacterium]
MAKVAIVGCGAMGSVYAALMADAGHEVHAVTLWPDHAGAMRTQGLRVEGASGDRTVRLASAGPDTNGIGPCDLVVIRVPSGSPLTSTGGESVGRLLAFSTGMSRLMLQI